MRPLRTFRPASARSVPDSAHLTEVVEKCVADALASASAVVLAVSGGRDSMVMLEAAARVAPRSVSAVATFDHGTGRWAKNATALVAERARELGLEVVRERVQLPGRSEAEWRRFRLDFFDRVARARHAVVVTAHTLDDQIETILMRILRGSGARGLAALEAPGGTLRPFLGISRELVARYAAARAVAWLDDPSNWSRRYLRNRVRHDLLPALTRARPALPEELLIVGQRAASLRDEVERVLDTLPGMATGSRGVTVARSSFEGYDPRSLALLWPAIAGRGGIALDRRGTERLCQFTMNGSSGRRIQLSGGLEALIHRGSLIVRPSPEAATGVTAARPLADGVRLGRWVFRRSSGRAHGEGGWTAALPLDVALTVRTWQPGDRMVPAGSATPRRVKGLLRDAGVDGPSRHGWPVVLAGSEIVWVPGVRRALAATEQAGRPSAPYISERLDS